MDSTNSSVTSSTSTQLSSLGKRASSHTFETSTGLHRAESIGVQTDSAQVQQLSPVRHPDLWFSDGSVVLKAQNTLFRVHISQLSRHSAFFRDLFSLPQPPRGGRARSLSASSVTSVTDGGQLEGCPVVYLHDDTAEDVGNLLSALYDGPSFGSNDQEDFRMVSGILRLSTKYLCDSLRAKALAHLSIAWPSDLKSWDAREDAARYEMDSENVANIGHIYPTPIAVINLAREIDAPSLLPSAFYDLSRYSYAQIFEASDESPVYSTPPIPFLSLIDMQKLTLGKEASQQAITTLIQSMGNSQYHPQHHSTSHSMHSAAHLRKACASAAACRKDFSELVELATQHYLFDRERGCGDPMYVAEELGQLKSAELSGSDCKACAKSLETWAAREREKIWKLIPTWFRLEVPVPVPQAANSKARGDRDPMDTDYVRDSTS